ncbi:HAMP domain-containing sensor histidine kinase [Sulfitobacter sp. R18_1]|uniref:sensor histidine kinase n=1 Tax=Sulfitobacter sp. R18_1 TaxID=2821104 RepID=UPI001ADBFE45|nr:HAMP domain-containing sensor histidine kinase [Sulfitobacter sp. R18_1]MBO9430732.1 HAMP domain-containing histidine kinase [Sulfitobacter sp. R18_1]
MTQRLLKLPADHELPSCEEPQPAGPDAEEFIHLVSHDLRSSIRALLELPEWIAEDIEYAGLEINASVHSSIALMKRHTRRLDRMLVDLLQYSRAGRGRDASEVELKQAFHAAVEEVGPPSGFRVNHHFGCDSFRFDEQDLHSLFVALIGNAIKHHDRFSGRVKVVVKSEGEAMMLTVSDDGPGIPPRYHERVFQPMTTLRSRDEVEGSGLGLALVRKIAGAYGGHACLVSTGAERGTTVSVRLEGVAMT